MISTFLKVVSISIWLVNCAWALPWLQNVNEFKTSLIQQSNFHDENPNTRLNFSGSWVGQCNNSPSVDMTIKHDENQITISYGFMEEKYTLGKVKAETSSCLDASESSNTTVRWSEDYSALIFINYNLYINAQAQLNIFFSKVSMALEDDEIRVKGYYYHTNATSSDLEQDSILCSYHRK